MIVTTKVTHGMIVTICNYDFYQTMTNYEGYSVGHDEGNTKGNNKKKNGRKKERKPVF
jgi:hypothetical protein